MNLRRPIDWAKAACDTLMRQYEPIQLPPENRWHYHQGVFLVSMLQVWRATGEKKYYDYVKKYADDLIDENGNFFFARDELDAIQAGLLLFVLDREDGAPRYRIAARKLRMLFETLNRTEEGGLWHKDKYPYQMWLDGLYMGGVFAMEYDRHYGEPELTELALLQERLMRKHMKDETTGLYYHAWDARKRMPWANPATGCSPEFWARSLGWYGLALVEFLDILPPSHPSRDELIEVLRDFVHALIRYQDEGSGLWHQVVDKGSDPSNWLETSGTSLFVYAIAGAIRLGAVNDGASRDAAIAGYEGLIRTVRLDGQGNLTVPDICIGTSAGDYTNYITRPKSDNDLHGVGAFVMACCAIDSLA